MIVFGENEAKRIHEVVKRVEKSPRDERGPRRRGPIDYFDYSDEDGGTGGSGCCCNEFHCLRIPGLPSTVTLRPSFYEFTPSTLLCGCDPTAKARLKTRLYRVTEYVYESKHGVSDDPIECLTPKLVEVDCTATATWVWTQANCNAPTVCSGGCQYLYNGSTWQVTSNTCGDSSVAGCFSCNGCAAPEGGFPVSPSPGDTLTTACADPDILDPEPAHWELVGIDVPSCDCTPAQPDFDGTSLGQTATTTCDVTSEVESDTEFELAVAYWRLTISETLDYYGCDQTKLEFIVGTKVMFTLYLQDRCGKRFCRICTTTFRLSSCVPLCEDGPTTICLKPVLPVAICTCSDTPIVPLATGLTFDVGSRQESWTGDYVFSSVLDSDGNPVPCLWEIRFPDLTYDQDLNINIYSGGCHPFMHVMTRVTLSGVLTLTLNFTAPDTYCWQLSLIMNHEGVALVDLNEAGCHIAAGTQCYHRDEDILGTELCGVYPCTDPFDMQILGYPIFTDPIVGISFLDGSKL